MNKQEIKYCKLVGGTFAHYQVKRTRNIPQIIKGVPEMLQGNLIFCVPTYVNLGPFSGTYHEAVAAYPLHSN